MDGLAGNQARNLEDMTLKYDGTTKSGYYVVEVQVETKENTYFVGIVRRPQVGKLLIMLTP